MTTRTLDQLLETTLPLNRKERYFTGTVLPALLGPNLEYLDRLAKLIGIDHVDVRTSRDDCSVLLFTEYGIAESAIGSAVTRFLGLPTGRDTPDVVVLITEPKPVLLALEAKLYDRPSRAEMVTQLERQDDILTPLASRLTEWLGGEAVQLVHVALLPSKLAAAFEKVEPLPVPVLSWEEILEAWSDVRGYYFEILDIALSRYDELLSKWTGYQDNELLGTDIVRRSEEGTLQYGWMGRRGGFTGTDLTADVSSGKWKTTRYQVRKDELPGNPNWFSVASFIAAVTEPPDPQKEGR